MLAVGDGDEALTGHLLTRFTQIADFDALIHLRTRLNTTLRATRSVRPNSMSPVAPGVRSSLCRIGQVGVLGWQDVIASEG